ncbi:MAG TPA: preprotein translocase subunit SecA [Nitrospiraceae bacterium]|nr:preprotein translocase subunit SecA [Nitrospiraceae bacterium]
MVISGVGYPERLLPHVGKLEEWIGRAIGPVARRLRAAMFRRDEWILSVAAEGEQYGRLRDADLKAAAQSLRPLLVRHGFRNDLAAKAFALIREVAQRTIGQRHFDVQLLGGWVLLTGRVAEMDTGEGKTLTATLPACTAALAGMPVHVVTVNDYLAGRDADAMGPVYAALGLTVGVVKQGMDPEARRAAYACDVTYCTNKELVFDYLKDRLVVGQMPSQTHLHLERLHGSDTPQRLLLRGLHYAIVDEADSVLVDEARTPLIIAQRSHEATEHTVYEQALTLASRLTEGEEFVIDHAERHVRLTARGETRLEELTESFDGVWKGRRRREAFVQQALTAQHLFHREQHYLVQEESIRIIDEYTGRVMPDRSWERGLHQMIEVKEGCPLGHRQETLARISYQRFFRRYLRLAGMTGTAREVAGELWSVYRLGVVRIPTNRPTRRTRMPDQIHVTADAKWRAIVSAMAESRQSGRSVLVGTRTVAASDHLSSLLKRHGIPHRVLNARQDEEEAAIIAEAGEPGRMTVATNMAGRGTDVRLGPGVAEAGGLHVIATERHDASRIDRQLFGRCGRQGDPGTYQAILSLEDELIMAQTGTLLRGLLRLVCSFGRSAPIWAGRVLFWWTQHRAERTHARMRMAVLKMDEHLNTALAFAGRPE